MMKLHWSPRSPFVRKVMITLHETGLIDEVTTVRSPVAVHLPPNPEVIADNPVAKIPTLVTEDGIGLFDSRVICEYLDMRAGTALFPAEPGARIAQLRWQALADGMTDVLLVWRTELTRQDGPWPALVDGWQTKVRSAMARLEAESAALESAPFGIGTIATVCALGQLDFRWPDCDWRSHFPRLAAAEAEWSRHPSVAACPVESDGEAAPGELTRGQLRF